MADTFMTGQGIQIARGEYVGSGTNTKTLEFPFTPMFVYVQSTNQIMTGGSYDHFSLPLTWGNATLQPSASLNYTINVLGNSMTITLTYGDKSPNHLNMSYRWVAIG